MASTGSRARLPRFLPPDPRVEQPYLFTPKMALRVAILGAVALVAIGVLLLRLWSLEVLSGSKYRAQALDNQLRTVSVEAPRGPILDAEGRVLVTNVISQAVDVWPVDLPGGSRRDAELRQLAIVLNMPYAEVRRMIRRHTDTITPVTLKVAIHPEQVQYIKEHAAQFRGVEIRRTYLRGYTRNLLAQTLGYVGAITADQYKALRKDGYQRDDRIGQSGVEAAYDRYLHGRAGVDQFRVDSAGRPTSSPLRTTQPQPGDAIRLTIDVGLQQRAEDALRFGIHYAQGTTDGWAADGGALVAMDVNTGAVLAMASNPTYPPRVWVSRDPKQLKPLQDTAAGALANFPGLNRAIDVRYPPGSTWKPVTALAALEEHLVGPYESLLCSPSYTVKTIYGVPQTFKNWNPYVNQWMTMPTALAQSCDTYFYQLGQRFYDLPAARGQPLQKWATSAFGFGQPTGIDIGPEDAGLVPTITWRKETYTRETDPTNWRIDSLWKPGDSIQLAIGQKDVAVTPIQLARFYAMIANGGKLVTPHVVADVEVPSPSGKDLPTILRSFAPPAPKASGADPADLQVVRDGLYQATHDPLGTSYSTFGNFPVCVAGKTGTAEKVVTLPGRKDTVLLNQALWVGYAPCDHPKIVVAVVIENGGHGGTAAAPAAAQFLARYFDTNLATTGGTAQD